MGTSTDSWSKLVLMTQVPDPPTRHEQQQQTRAALIRAAKSVFAEHGFHGAKLDQIARTAGFSKGAVYSNFAGKSMLFLAVLDADIAEGFGQAWDRYPGSRPGEEAQPSDHRLVGFALATLEFIAMAARDDELSAALQDRFETLLDIYRQMARDQRSADETLPVEEVSKLLAAMDQGTGLISIMGRTFPDPDTYQAGMRRVVKRD